MFSLFWIFSVPVAVFMFPFCFVIGDLINEFFGAKTTRLVIIFIFIFNALSLGIAALGSLVDAAPFSSVSKETYDAVFLSAPRAFLGSVTAFIIGGFANALLFSRLKKAGAYLWVRAGVSSLLGIILDSLIFIAVTFAGVLPVKDLFMTVAGQIIAKAIISVALGVPLTMLISKALNKWYLK